MFDRAVLDQYVLNKNGIPILNKPKKKVFLCSQHQEGPENGPICDRCKESNDLLKKMLGDKKFY